MAIKLGDIDGTIDEVIARHPASSGQTAHYTTIDIIDPQGVTATLSNIRVLPAIAAHIHVGAAGRYYVYNVAGFRGVHGFRPVNGAPVLAFPRYPAWICLGLVVANLLWIVWQTNLGGGVPLMALAPFMLASLLYAALRRAANDATAQVMGDTRPVIIPGQPAPATAASLPEAVALAN